MGQFLKKRKIPQKEKVTTFQNLSPLKRAPLKEASWIAQRRQKRRDPPLRSLRVIARPDPEYTGTLGFVAFIPFRE